MTKSSCLTNHQDYHLTLLIITRISKCNGNDRQNNQDYKFSPNRAAGGCVDDDGKSVNWFISSVSFSQRSKSFLGQWLSKGQSCMPFLSCLGTNWLKALLFLCEGKSDIAKHCPWLDYFPFFYISFIVTLCFLFSQSAFRFFWSRFHCFFYMIMRPLLLSTNTRKADQQLLIILSPYKRVCFVLHKCVTFD